jgi:hypothetical protein
MLNNFKLDRFNKRVTSLLYVYIFMFIFISEEIVSIVITAS